MPLGVRRMADGLHRDLRRGSTWVWGQQRHEGVFRSEWPPRVSGRRVVSCFVCGLVTYGSVCFIIESGGRCCCEDWNGSGSYGVSRFMIYQIGTKIGAVYHHLSIALLFSPRHSLSPSLHWQPSLVQPEVWLKEGRSQDITCRKGWRGLHCGNTVSSTVLPTTLLQVPSKQFHRLLRAG